jgi:AcrR family transcriptional regulator
MTSPYTAIRVFDTVGIERYSSRVNITEPTTRPPRAEVRERIIASAMTEFGRRGYADATLDAIAEQAGFTKGAVYSNFGSKEGLFYELMDRQVLGRARMSVDLLAELPSDLREAQRVLSTRLTEAISNNRDWHLLFMDYWSRALRDPEVGARFAEHRAQLRAAVTDAVVSVTESSGATLHVPAEWVTFVILALSNGLAVEELAQPGIVPPQLMGEVVGRLLHIP